jgi:hypothetical protein
MKTNCLPQFSVEHINDSRSIPNGGNGIVTQFIQTYFSA